MISDFIDSMDYATSQSMRDAYVGSGHDSSWLSGWSYRKSFYVLRGSEDVSNFPLKILIGESSGSSGSEVHCEGHCLSSFDDIRITTSNGTTLVNYYVEFVTGTSPNRIATVWINIASLSTTPILLFLYYGNSGAASASNGTNVFPVFEDFEWGSSGNDLSTNGGSLVWTKNLGLATIDTSKSFYGTRSAMFPGAASTTNYHIPVTMSNAIAFSVRIYKETAVTNGPNIFFGNGSRWVNVWINASEAINFYYGSNYNTGYTITPDAWNLIELNNFNWESGTYDIWVNDSKIYTSATMGTGNNYTNAIGFRNEDTTVGNDIWFDSIIVKSFSKILPITRLYSPEQTSGNIIVTAETSVVYSGISSLKGFAPQTTALNKTLVRSIPSFDLTYCHKITGRIRSNRTGSNIKLGFYDAGGVTNEITPNILNADTWQLFEYDIHRISAANKDAITQMILTIVNADADNTFYLDNIQYHTQDLTPVYSWISGFKYRKPFTVSRASGYLDNYAISITVGQNSYVTGTTINCSPSCKYDFSDIRFTNFLGQNLPYYIESITNTTIGPYATVWIKVDSIELYEVILYLYFGNTSATSESIASVLDGYSAASPLPTIVTIGDLENYREDDLGSYKDSTTKLLVEFNETIGSTSFIDSSFINNSITGASGGTPSISSNLRVGTVSGTGFAISNAVTPPFGKYSAYFPQTGGLFLSQYPEFMFRAEDFTIDFWIYPTLIDGNPRGIMGMRYSYNNEHCWSMFITQDYMFFDYTTNGSSEVYVKAAPPKINMWSHIAIVRKSNYIKIYLNGYLSGVSANIGSTALWTMTDTTFQFSIGVASPNTAWNTTYTYKGYLKEFRINRSAVWTSDFTPSNAPYSVDANTALLMHFESDYIDYACSVAPYKGNSSPLVLGLNGSQSIYAPDSDNWNFGSSPFTVDLWIQLITFKNTRKFLQQWTSTDYFMPHVGTHEFWSGQRSGNVDKSLGIVTPLPMISEGEWHHLALVRENKCVTKFYLDGKLTAYSTSIWTFSDISYNFYIGGYNTQSVNFRGFLKYVRVSKGFARWINNFTPNNIDYGSITSYYLDSENGSDTNPGISWNTSWRTIKYGALTLLSAGSTVKIAKSPDPVSIGNATWTHKSSTVTLENQSVPLIYNIDGCDSGWIASANITVSYDTGARKEGTAALSLYIGSTSVTGKLAYKTLSTPINLSAYRALSFWYSDAVGISSNNKVKICLCSDISGNTIVDTFYVQNPNNATSLGWTPRYVNKGSVLGNSIQSIAIYVEINPGYRTLYFDNIMACNDFSLLSLISKQDVNGEYEAWYSIRSIVGSIITLDQNSLSNYLTPKGYYGTGGTFITYRREPFIISNSDAFHPQSSGVENNPINFYGGWDTNLNTQNGQTYIDGLGLNTNGIVYNTQSYTKMTNINPVRGYKGFTITGNNNELSFECSANNNTNGLSVTGNYNSCVGNFLNNNGFDSALLNISGNCNTIDIKQLLSGGIGITTGGYGNRIIFDIIANMFHATNSGIVVNSSLNKFFGGAIKDSAALGILLNTTTGSNWFYDILMQSNVVDIQSNNTAYGIQYFVGCTLQSVTPFKDNGIVYDSECRFIKQSGNVNSSNIYKSGGTVSSQETIRYTGSGIAWKISPTSTSIITKYIPLIMPLAKIAVMANAQVTVSAWMRRTDAGIVGKLVCPEKQIAGVLNEVSASLTDVGGWQQLSIQFTPTETGVVEIQVYAYGGTTYSVYVDDLTVSQG